MRGNPFLDTRLPSPGSRGSPRRLLSLQSCQAAMLSVTLPIWFTCAPGDPGKAHGVPKGEPWDLYGIWPSKMLIEWDNHKIIWDNMGILFGISPTILCEYMVIWCNMGIASGTQTWLGWKSFCGIEVSFAGENIGDFEWWIFPVKPWLPARGQPEFDSFFRESYPLV